LLLRAFAHASRRLHRWWKRRQRLSLKRQGPTMALKRSYGR
jgi:hypothetical protein